MKKHCLFCNELATAEMSGDYDTFGGCMCAPEGFYELRQGAYAAIQAFTYAKKRSLLPVVSAYIRERSEEGEHIALTLEQVEAIAASPDVPMTQEEKEKRLLRFLYRRTEAPLEPVQLHPMSRHYNLAYSANLQEFVFIIEQLRERGQIIREGAVLKLTEQGWSEAASIAGGGKKKRCAFMAGDDSYGMELFNRVLPGLEQCGYQTQLLLPSALSHSGGDELAGLSESKFVISDLTGAGPESYYMAGYAACKGIPIIWTVHRDQADHLIPYNKWIRPITWDTPEELVTLLQQRI